VPNDILHDVKMTETVTVANEVSEYGMGVCRDFMNFSCTRPNCRYIHDKQLCYHFWKHGSCKFGDECRRKHQFGGQGEKPKSDRNSNNNRKRNNRQRRVKNTECFEPMTEPVDMRIVYELGSGKANTQLTTRDVLVAPNVFGDFAPGELYNKLVEEIENCGVPEEKLLKLWHGNDKIEGTHFIADDKTKWKEQCPTFTMVLDRLRSFFQMDIQATRFNWYKDTSQWKPFHHDAAYVKPEKAALQNFTVAVSFGATRDAAFEHAKTKTVVSMPQSDGCIYAFAKDTNGIWRHGILQDVPVREEGRISVIAWGWVDNMKDV